MAFYILVENKLIDLRVTPVNMEMQSESYLELNVSRRLPVAKIETGVDPTGADISNIVAETTDDLEKLIKIWKCPQLATASENPEVGRAENLASDILKSFNILLKTKNDKPLISILSRIDTFLAANHTKYLISDEVTYSDCVLMPRLQHVRVAGRELAGFDIPTQFEHVAEYIKNMYTEKVFQTTCPKNRDIIAQHEEKVYVPRRKNSTLFKDDNKLLTIDTKQGQPTE